MTSACVWLMRFNRSCFAGYQAICSFIQKQLVALLNFYRHNKLAGIQRCHIPDWPLWNGGLHEKMCSQRLWNYWHICVLLGSSNSDSLSSEEIIDDFAERSVEESNSSESDFENKSENSGRTPKTNASSCTLLLYVFKCEKYPTWGYIWVKMNPAPNWLIL